MSKKHIQWLKSELPKLTEQEVLSTSAAEKLQQHYKMDNISSEISLSLFTIILATIGGLLVGGGIILIFAYNWENIDRPMRTVLAFTPLVIAQVLTVMALYPEKRGTAWREVAGVLLFCGVAAAISIIGQTYHISGDFQGFITWWYLLILPIVYLLRAHLMTILMVLLAGYAAANFSLIYMLCLVALLPYYIRVINEENTAKATQFGWTWAIAFIPLVPFQFIFSAYEPLSVPMILSLSTCLYLLGSTIEIHQAAWKRPITTLSAFAIGGYLISLSFNFVLQETVFVPNFLSSFSNDGYYESSQKGYLAIMLFFALNCIFAIYQLYLRNFKVLVLPSALALYITTGLILESNDYSQTSITLSSSIFTLATVIIGSWYMYLGIKKDSTSKLNYGLALIVGLVVFKFFIDDFSLITRGIAFIVLGTILISINVWHNRRGAA